MTATMPTDERKADAAPNGWGVRTLITPEGADLTGQEARLFDALYRRGVVGRAELLSLMWGPGEHGDTRAVDGAMKRMRRKLAPKWEIDGIPGKGYILRRAGVEQS